MASTEDGDQDLLDHILLTDDHLLNLASNPVEDVLNLGSGGGRVVLMQLWVGHHVSVSCAVVKSVGRGLVNTLATEWV
jgi:hypothetical protein